MSLAMYWTEQAVSEVTCTLKVDDDQLFSALLLNFAALMQSLEVDVLLLGAQAKAWLLLVREAERIKRGDQTQFSATKEQRDLIVQKIATAVVHYCNEHFGLYTI